MAGITFKNQNSFYGTVLDSSHGHLGGFHRAAPIFWHGPGGTNVSVTVAGWVAPHLGNPSLSASGYGWFRTGWDPAHNSDGPHPDVPWNPRKTMTLRGGAYEASSTENVNWGKGVRNSRIYKKLAVEAGFDFVGLKVSGFDKARPWTLLSSTAKIARATNEVVSRFKTRRPDAVATFGAYVSIPVGRAAGKLGVPLVIHEQNSVPGMANAYLAKRADATALTYEQSRSALKSKTPAVVTGNPVRASFETCSRQAGRALLGIPEDALVLLVFGGSLGARHLNTAVCAMKERLLSLEGLHIIHSTGSLDYDSVCEQLMLSAEEKERWHVLSYIDRMVDVLAASDLVVSRAGANAICELLALRKPNILIPLGADKSRGDQILNANSFEKQGFSCVLLEENVTPESLTKAIKEVYEERDSYIHAMAHSGQGDAIETIVGLVKELS